jgi:hypothetical protein
LLLLCPRHAVAQFVFLDANGDGVNDASDQLAQDGPTDVDVWFVTNENRDGSAAVCSSNPAQLLAALGAVLRQRGVASRLRRELRAAGARADDAPTLPPPPAEG